ncbi:hypothetical protein C8J56DRAFT_1126614 [Mycena floridula]|nr:hypothetical protein C8J56DRAFT_1126614 [Mycena floridula]
MLSSTGVRPSRLSLDLRLRQNLGNAANRFNYPIFSLLTHLEIWDGGVFSDFDPSSLQSMVHLTHLALMNYRTPLIQEITRLLPRLTLPDTLQVCMIFRGHSYRIHSGIMDWTTSNEVDLRIVFAYMPVSSPDDLVSHNTVILGDFLLEMHFAERWGRHRVEGEADAWDEAEAIVAARKAGD